jgi:hypothetical protein
MVLIDHRIPTEWQRPLSGVHSIMMEKFAQAGEKQYFLKIVERRQSKKAWST